MGRMRFGGKGGKIRPGPSTAAPARPTDEVIRELKKSLEKPKGEDYRERSLAIHGKVCGRCGREFDASNLPLLTVHHKDGNHHNNPPDGSNWENLCVYCHDDVHSRAVLAEYVDGGGAPDDRRVVYRDEAAAGGGSALAEALERARRKREGKS